MHYSFPWVASRPRKQTLITSANLTEYHLKEQKDRYTHMMSNVTKEFNKYVGNLLESLIRVVQVTRWGEKSKKATKL